MEMSKSKQTFRVTGRKTIETPITILVVRKYQIHRRTAFCDCYRYLYRTEYRFRMLAVLFKIINKKE